MKALILILFLAVMPALAFEINGNKITLTDQDMAACQRGGGCIVATRRAIVEMKDIIGALMEEIEATKAPPAKDCRRTDI